ncbi:MAG TPA: hypothetical protein VFZ20_22165 [Longimicrobium sp.]|nr:hypothetical protein [Longimicrobium sp.]
MPGPWFSLEQFKAELRTDNFHVYRGRALDPIARLLRCSPRQARAFARRAALALQEADYAHTLMMPNGQIQDVYGRMIDMDGWYLKIEIHMEDGQPGIVSCHPAEHDLITLGGLIPSSLRRE